MGHHPIVVPTSSSLLEKVKCPASLASWSLTALVLLQSGLTSLEMTSMTHRLASLCQVRLISLPEEPAQVTRSLLPLYT